MSAPLLFTTTREICSALGEFAQARRDNNKDVILQRVNLDGRETLQVAHVSEMKWYQRLVRYFGFGSSTLSAVAKLLQENEPALPRRFSDRKAEYLSCHYGQIDLLTMGALSKQEFKKLRDDKARGCEVFKSCLARYNTTHRFGKTYILLQEREKVDLNSSPCSPMGLLPGSKDEEKLALKYKAPIINPEKFHYLDPFFRTPRQIRDFNVTGFSYEYGLGVDKDLQSAKSYYELGRFTDLVCRFNFIRLSALMKDKGVNVKDEAESLRLAVRSELGNVEAALSLQQQRRTAVQSGDSRGIDPQHLLSSLDQSITHLEGRQSWLNKFLGRISLLLGSKESH